MKKLKMALVTLVIALAVGGAFATAPAPCQTCANFQQYYRIGNYYFNAYSGEYTCEPAADICTYWRPDPIGQPYYYIPCKYGYYTPIW